MGAQITEDVAEALADYEYYAERGQLRRPEAAE